MYRNGVAYFERAGTVDSNRVEFDVKPEHVGDFLATLSVVEHGGSSVRSASFPIKVAEAQEARADAAETPPDSPPGKVLKSALKRVVLQLDGGKHDLRVGYVSEQPVWKPSYRLVFDESGPTLQAWGIVQNVSGEDWTNVSMSLVAGAPIAFQSTLATPVTPRRPVVTDTGELIAAVPRGENTLAQRPPSPSPAPPPMATPPPPRDSAAKPPSRAPGMPAPSYEAPQEPEWDAPPPPPVSSRLFRGSITRPAHSLSKLRSPRHPVTTQDSLPAGGPLYRAGFAPAGPFVRFLPPSLPPRLGALAPVAQSRT